MGHVDMARGAPAVGGLAVEGRDVTLNAREVAKGAALLQRHGVQQVRRPRTGCSICETGWNGYMCGTRALCLLLS